jgi:hypothetical protein
MISGRNEDWRIDVRVWISAIIAGAALLANVPLLAHHAFTSFWLMDRTVQIEGIVKEVRLVNPHPEMKIEVTEVDGQTSIWNITARGTGTTILKAGWTRDTVPIGSKVKVEGNPSRKEGMKALAAGRIIKSDGSVVWFGGGGGIPQG